MYTWYRVVFNVRTEGSIGIFYPSPVQVVRAICRSVAIQYAMEDLHSNGYEVQTLVSCSEPMGKVEAYAK